MKQLFLILFLTTTILACKNEPKNQAGNSAGNAAQAKVKGSAEPATPLENNRETALLTKDFWVFEYYVIPGDEAKSFYNRGIWYKLQMDGTYEYGHWDEVLGKGAWKLAYVEDNKPVITVDSETDDSYDMIWEVSLGTYQGFEASFVAGRNSQQPGVMCKMINLQTRPTKKQFGYE